MDGDASITMLSHGDSQGDQLLGLGVQGSRLGRASGEGVEALDGLGVSILQPRAILADLGDQLLIGSSRQMVVVRRLARASRARQREPIMRMELDLQVEARILHEVNAL